MITSLRTESWTFGRPLLRSMQNSQHLNLEALAMSNADLATDFRLGITPPFATYRYRSLVRCGTFNVIDHQDIHPISSRFEFQTQLIAKCLEDRRPVRPLRGVAA